MASNNRLFKICYENIIDITFFFYLLMTEIVKNKNKNKTIVI